MNNVDQRQILVKDDAARTLEFDVPMVDEPDYGYDVDYICYANFDHDLEKKKRKFFVIQLDFN